jgi:hypothetical protein
LCHRRQRQYRRDGRGNQKRVDFHLYSPSI